MIDPGEPEVFEGLSAHGSQQAGVRILRADIS
jgi:hypothetical protein